MTEEDLRSTLSALAQQAQTAEGFERLIDVVVEKVVHTETEDIIYINLTGDETAPPEYRISQREFKKYCNPNQGHLNILIKLICSRYHRIIAQLSHSYAFIKTLPKRKHSL